MLSYAGIPLCEPSALDLARIEMGLDWGRLLDFERLILPNAGRLGWSFNGILRDRPRALNALYWPRGASRWAVGWFLATANQLVAIRQQVYSTGAGGYQALPLVLSDGTRSIETNLYMLPPRPVHQIPGVTGEPGTGDNQTPSEGQLWVITLVDHRFFWWQTSIDTVVTEGTTTWLDLYGQIETALGISLTIADIDAAYGKPSVYLASTADSLPLLLDTIAYNVGQRIIRNLDNSVACQSYTLASQRLISQLIPDTGYFRKLRGGQFLFKSSTQPCDLNGLVPASVTIAYPKLIGTLPAAGFWSTDVTLSSLALDQFSGITGHPGTKRLRDVCRANLVHAGDVDPSNKPELVALTTQWAKDWYKWQLGTLALEWAGTPTWNPEGLHDFVLWTHRPGHLGCRIERGVFWDDCESLDHNFFPLTDVITFVTKVCDTISGGNVKSVTMQGLGIRMPAEWIVDSTFCETDDTGCCNQTGSGSGGNPVLVSCCPNGLPEALCVTKTSDPDNCDNCMTLNVPYTITYRSGIFGGSQAGWAGDFTCAGGPFPGSPFHVYFYCGDGFGNPGPFQLEPGIGSGGNCRTAPTTLSCDPFSAIVTFDPNSGDGSHCGLTCTQPVTYEVTACGGGGGGGISRTSLGVAVATSSLTLTKSVSVAAGALLIVNVGLVEAGGASTVSGVTFNGVAMDRALVKTMSGGKEEISLWFITVGSTTTANVIITQSTTGDRIMASFVEVQGLAINLPDGGALNTGLAVTDPTTSATGMTGVADEYCQALFFLLDAGGAWTWAGGFTSGGQDLNEVDMGTNFDLTEGYEILSATGTPNAQLTGITPTEFAAILVTFR